MVKYISSLHKTSNIQKLVEMASGNMPENDRLEREQILEKEERLERLERRAEEVRDKGKYH